MQVLSVNIAHPVPNRGAGASMTGIDKRPVVGPVAVSAPGPRGTGAVGLAGDRVFDLAHHGGTDQAVYAYAREDLDGWEGQLGRSLPDGVFGENLTTAGVDLAGALIGERWRIGADVVLEVSCPRIPCATFEGWLRRDGWISEFMRAARPGAYLRVVSAGEIAAGDPIAVVYRPTHDVTIAVAFRALTLEPDLLPRLLAADALPQADRDLVRRRTAEA
ncbi:MAG: MOSC domain-containing protein [Cellulomonas sp.]